MDTLSKLQALDLGSIEVLQRVLLITDGTLTEILQAWRLERILLIKLAHEVKKGDVLVVITTSGNSTNILSAIAAANIAGLHTIALLGRDGGRARGLAQFELIVPTTITARIQEAQKFLLHTLCEIVETRWLLPQPGAH